MNSERDRDPREDMSFLKLHWLLVVGLVVLLCVALGVFSVWHANQSIEPKTVYLMPEPNPERAEILKRMTQPHEVAYVPNASPDEATDSPFGETPDAPGDESSSQENDVENDDIESMHVAIDEGTAEKTRDFPPVPVGFIYPPVWIGIPGYKKGDMPEHELICRVLIKLWNQGDRKFVDGLYSHNDGKVYPIYDDVVYVQWREKTLDWGKWKDNPINIRYIATQKSTRDYRFEPEDFIDGTWSTKYPGVTFVNNEDAGYDPATFLTEND